MSSLSPFLLVATLVAAVGAASVSQAQAPSGAQTLAQLRSAAASVSTVGDGVLVLAAR